MRVHFLLGLMLIAGCVSPEPTDPTPPLPSPTSAAPETMAPNATSTAQPGPVVRIVDTGFRGPEPTIVSASDGTLFLAAVGNVSGGDDYILRSMEGLEWAVSYDYPGFGPTNIPNLDPMLEIGPVNDAVYAMAQVSDWCTDLSISTDLGESWSTARPACNRPPVDHIKLVASPPGPTAVLDAADSVLTMCANSAKGFTTSCFISYDQGTTWPVESVVFTEASGCAGLVGKPEASLAGVLAIPAVWGCPEFLTVAFSQDNGHTWSIEQSPLPRAPAINPGAGFTPDGTFYAAARIVGETVAAVRYDGAWSGPWNVTASGVRSTVFVTAEAGSDGHVAVAYLGTKDSNEHPTDAPEDVHWHLYIAWTTDGGSDSPTWSIVQATPDEDPVQIGSICLLNRPCSEGNRNLLDFIDSTITPDGRFVVAFADGCTAECAGNPDATHLDSRDARAKVAILEGIHLRP